MFTIKNKVYSEAGYILVKNNIRFYQKEGNSSEYSEEPLSLEDLIIDGRLVKYSKIVQNYNPTWTYAQLKTDMIHKRYSNDDQIAIMLNKDNSLEDTLAYDKMQEWRDWSGRVAKAIIEKRN